MVVHSGANVGVFRGEKVQPMAADDLLLRHLVSSMVLAV